MRKFLKKRICMRCRKRKAPEGMHFCTKCKKIIKELSGGFDTVHVPMLDNLQTNMSQFYRESEK